MSTRFEGAGARDTKITILAAGEEIGDDVVPEGQIALAFNYDEVFYLQGKAWEVRKLLFEGIEQINKGETGRLNVVMQYANRDPETGFYGDIYATPEDVRKDHPEDEVLTGFGVLDAGTGFIADDAADWYDTEDEALAFISLQQGAGNE